MAKAQGKRSLKYGVFIPFSKPSGKTRYKTICSACVLKTIFATQATSY
jgi:hypothetical protein